MQEEVEVDDLNSQHTVHEERVEAVQDELQQVQQVQQVQRIQDEDEDEVVDHEQVETDDQVLLLFHMLLTDPME